MAWCAPWQCCLRHLFVMATFVLLSQATRYPLSSSWSLRHIPNPAQAIHILYDMEALLYPLFSDASFTFVLGFLTFPAMSAPSYTLSLLMFSGDTSAQITWTANRNTPVQENALLTITPSGDLALIDAPGTLAWTAPLAAGNLASGLEIVDGKGLIRLYDNHNKTLWQNWDFPTDTLLISQFLIPGMKLVANSSPFNQSEGQYSLIMVNSGLVALINFPNSQPQPYWSLQLRTCGSNTTAKALFDRNSISVLPINADDAICQPHAWYFEYPSSLQMLKLDYDGSISAYSPASTYWEIRSDVFGCALPLVCGHYGICSSDARCTCPSFTKLDERFNDCLLPLPLTCDYNRSELHLMPLYGISYFSNQYSTPLANISSVEDCKQTCLLDCKCSAAFYHNHTGFCFHIDTVLSLMNVSSSNFNAFIKIRTAIDPLPVRNMGTTAPPIPDSQRRQMHIAIITTILTLALLCLLVSVFLLKRYWRKSGTAQKVKLGEYCNESIGGEIYLRYTFKELKTATNGFSVKLGEGGFGSVYKGTLANGKVVAIKRLESTMQGKKQFLAEVATLGKIYHVNLVQLLGFCSQASHRLLVYDYMPNGSLNHWLFEKEKKDFLAWPVRFQIALGTACGLAYLHERCDQRILHFDIKPENILLDDNFIAKVSDFGMCKLISRNRSRVMTMIRGTPAYMAPEWLLYFGVTEKSDVFSYGLVLLEIVSGCRIVGSCEGAGSKHDGVKEDATTGYLPLLVAQKLNEGSLIDVIDKRLGGEFNEEEASRILRVALWCIQQEPCCRPSMDSVVKMLGGITPVQDPPLDLHFLAQNYSRICALLNIL